MDPKQTVETFYTVEPLLFWLVGGMTGVCAIATVVTQNIVRSATWLLFTLAGTSAIFFLLGADLVGATQLLVYVGGTLVLVIFGVMLTAQGPFISMKASGAEWAISLVAGLLLLAVLATGIGAMKVDDQRDVTANADVKRYAPEFSRHERELLTARPPAPPKEPPPGLQPGPPLLGGPAFGPPKGLGDGGDKKKGDGGDKKKGDGGDKKKGGGDKKKGGGDKKAGPPGGPGMIGFKPPTPKKGPTEPPEPLDPATSPQSAVLGQGFLGLGVGPAHHAGKSPVVRTSYLLPFEIVSVHLLVVLIGAAYLARAKRRRGTAP
jgi:NADH:ubiquinone oxidoreductase subunit 6 (subunit J)